MSSSPQIVNFHPRNSYSKVVDCFMDNYQCVFYDVLNSSEIVSLLCCTMLLNYGTICIHDALCVDNIWVP